MSKNTLKKDKTYQSNVGQQQTGEQAGADFSPLSERLRYFMRIRGNLSEIDLARLASLPQPTVHHILSGNTQRPHRKTLVALAKALGTDIWSLLELSVDELEKLHTRSVAIVPLISWEESLNWPAPKSQNPYFAASSSVVTDVHVGSNAFALKVKDSSMETLFPEGTVLIVDPDKEVKNKSFVIIHLKGEKEAVFKQTVFDGRNCYLKSLNPHFDKIEPKLMAPEDRIVGVVVQTRINLE